MRGLVRTEARRGSRAGVSCKRVLRQACNWRDVRANNDSLSKVRQQGQTLEDICLPARSASSLRIRFGPLALAVLLAAPLGPSWADDEALSALAAVATEVAQKQNEALSALAAVATEVAQKQKLRALFPDPTTRVQPTPPVILQLQVDGDSSGTIATFQPNGSTPTASNAFFQNLGSNGRTCFTCHQPQDGWSLSAQDAQARFNSDPTDPLFRRVDGATCPSADVSTLAAQRAAYSLLTNKGLIRIGLPMQSAMEFQILDVSDPYGCDNNPITGLTGSKSGILSFYRRPLPSTNLGFLSTIMWDGREPDLFQQSVDATLGHAQGNPPGPSPNQQQQIVTFEGCTTANSPLTCANTPKGAGIFTAQIHDNNAGDLTADHANGGPVTLATKVTSFFIGINDPLGLNPNGAVFNPVIFDVYNPWADLNGQGGGAVAARRAIARGQQVFNSVPINITGVGGLNDLLNQPSISGFCGTCHDTPDVGNHSVKAPLNIGIANAGNKQPAGVGHLGAARSSRFGAPPGRWRGTRFGSPTLAAPWSAANVPISAKSKDRFCAGWRRGRLTSITVRPLRCRMSSSSMISASALA